MSELNLGFEQKLWEMADKMRGRMGVKDTEYGNVVLGLIFLKYISDSFEERFNELVTDNEGFEEDIDAYAEEHIFFVPKEARWDYIKSQATQPSIGKIIDDAMLAIEKNNPTLKGILPKTYARSEINKIVLGELVNLFSFNMGSKEAKAQDILGRVYEYFLGNFGSSDGEYYTPPTIVKLLVGMIEPFKGRVYDPCCGSGGMFVQSSKFVKEHQGRLDDIHIFGQEAISETWKLCKMNLAIRGIDGDLGDSNGDTFGSDKHKLLKADFILANPPFNIKDWGAANLQEDVRWKYGMPPAGNANYAWIEHMISKLSPKGIAGFVLANGSMSTSTTSESEIRKNIIEDGLVDCIVTMPPNLFYNVTIPVCLWFISKNKSNRKDKILFIDARKMGTMVTRKHRELSDDEIKVIFDTYHNYQKGENYDDIKGFCKSSSLEEVRSHDYILTPGRYVGIEEVEDDGISFDDKMKELTTELSAMFEKSHELESEVKIRLGAIGYDL